ncbi:MAG: aminotransferase class V-fold PLP-dependent enzyme [Acidobacteria bacterium]|nr:aminotransferase class V-fold PLP-dependent enzyme [Acidobacteriota bacterium]
MNELLKWREEFPILEKTTYLISNSLGAMPRGVHERMQEYAETWATRGVRAWEEGWWELAAETGDRIGALNADFAVGGVLKWLCGGPGVAYLYVRPDLRGRLEPGVTGWFAHRRPFQFEPGPIERRDDAFRFLTGTTQVPALYACQPGLEIISQVGVERIRENSVRQTTRLMEGARARGWQVNSPANSRERGGTVSVECPHAAEVMQELLARDILVDYRPKAGIRLSPHFYNRDEEIDFALAQIEEILATRTWERHLQAV